MREVFHARRQAAVGKEILCGRSGLDAVGSIAQLCSYPCSEDVVPGSGNERSPGAVDRPGSALDGNKKVMGARVNPPVLKWLGWATAAIMAAAAIAMFATM